MCSNGSSNSTYPDFGSPEDITVYIVLLESFAISVKWSVYAHHVHATFPQTQEEDIQNPKIGVSVAKSHCVGIKQNPRAASSLNY